MLTLAAGCASAPAGSTSTSTSTYVGGSRSELYMSLEELAGASTGGVIVGVVTGQESEAGSGDPPVTISTLEVRQSVAIGELGTEGVPVLQAGQAIQVRQFGVTTQNASVTAPLLEQGEEYLLFLTESELPGDAAAQFFVTGVTAGIYRDSGSGVYERLVVEVNSDVLPLTITLADLEGGEDTSAAAFVAGEERRSPAPSERAAPWIAGYYLDEEETLVARVFADAPADLAAEDFLTVAGTPMAVQPSAYTQAELERLSGLLPELVTEGFSAEYDGARDLYTLTGDLDPDQVSAVFGDARYEVIVAEAPQRWSRLFTADPQR